MAKRSVPHAEGLDKRLQNPNFVREYLNAAAEEGRGEFLLALRDVARARGMTSVARESSLGRESLYKALSEDGNPEFDTVLAVLRAVGLKIQFETA